MLSKNVKDSEIKRILYSRNVLVYTGCNASPVQIMYMRLEML